MAYGRPSAENSKRNGDRGARHEAIRKYCFPKTFCAINGNKKTVPSAKIRLGILMAQSTQKISRENFANMK